MRWAFVADPCLNVKVLVPDECAPVEDGLKSSSHLETQAYRGKFEYKVFGECYVPMISSWYRTGGQLLTGGYKHCPLIYDDRREKVDTQGGACDNDVHEHFKCLEETLLKKCFIIIKDGEAESFGCNVIKNTRGFEIIPYEECDLIHVNSDNKYNIIFENKDYPVSQGLSFVSIAKNIASP